MAARKQPVPSPRRPRTRSSSRCSTPSSTGA
jgi:hypothetical protein